MSFWQKFIEEFKKDVEKQKLKSEEKQEQKSKLINNKNPSCPKCSSEHISAQKRGFKTGRALLFLPLGFIGRNDIELHCMSCGEKFKPND
jgi:ribosomal protein S27AE